MLMRTDPFGELDRLAGSLLGARAASVPMDAYREGDEFVARFDLPGVDPDSVDVEVEQNVVTVTAIRPALDEAQQRDAVVMERPTGTFTRRILLDAGLDTESIHADYTDGVLTLRVPVAEHAKPRKIVIGTDGGTRQISA